MHTEKLFLLLFFCFLLQYSVSADSYKRKRQHDMVQQTDQERAQKELRFQEAFCENVQETCTEQNITKDDFTICSPEAFKIVEAAANGEITRTDYFDILIKRFYALLSAPITSKGLSPIYEILHGNNRERDIYVCFNQVQQKMEKYPPISSFFEGKKNR